MLPEGAPDNGPAMHLIVPFASPPAGGMPPGASAEASTAWRAPHPPRLQGLHLPRLATLVARWRAGAADVDEPTSLTPPHERALGRALGLQAQDGCWPLAAVEAARLGLPGSDGAWAWLSPAHWRLGTEQVSMADPAALALDEASSRAFLETLRPVFEEQGITLHPVSAQRWLACHGDFEGVPCASLDRVAGRNVDPWLPADARARWLRRLQSEAQMLWHGHPLNETREARGELAVNSVWWSGCGRAGRAVPWPEGLVVDERLRAAALAADTVAWCRALESLDAQALPALEAAVARGEPAALTLCGERAAVTLRPAAAGGGLRPGPWLAMWLRAAGARLRGSAGANAGVAEFLENL